MKFFFRSAIPLLTLVFFTLNISAQTTKYKCLLQMSNYIGEGAYVVVSLINAKGEYEKTLYVMGDDKEWYNSLEEWHAYQTKEKTDISSITGASVTGGDRSITIFEIETAIMNKGNKLRFESSVEDQEYYADDVEIPLTTEAITTRTDGKGFIRYVKLNKTE